MRQCSRRMKRLLTILLIEIVIAVNVLSAYAFEGNSYTYTDQEVQLMQAAVQGGNSDAGGTAGNLIEPEEDGGNGNVENNEGNDNVNEGGTGEGNADGNVENNEGKDNENEGGTGEGGADGNVENNEKKDNVNENGSADGDAENNEGKDNEDEGDAEEDDAEEDGTDGNTVNGKEKDGKVENGTEKEDDTKGTTYDIAKWIDDVQLSYCKDGLDGDYRNYVNWTNEPIYPGYGLKANVAFKVPDGITLNYKDQLKFTLPDFLSGIVDAKDGIIVEKDSTTPIGSYEIVPGENGGEICLSFDKSYFENGGSISYGAVSFKGLMNVMNDITFKKTKNLYFGNFPVLVWLAPLDSGIGYLNIWKTHKNGSTPEIVTYTVTVEAREDSEVALREAVLKDAFTSGKEYVQQIRIDDFGVSNGTVDFQGNPYVTPENTLEWKIGTMERGSKVTCTYTVTFGLGEQALVQPIGYLENTATASAKNAKFPVKDSDRYEIPAKIKLDKKVIPQTFQDSRTGKSVTEEYNYEDHSAIYEITVTNENSSFPAFLDKLVDSFSQQERDIVVGYEDFEINGGSADAPETDAANGKITWKNVSIPAGGKATIRYKVYFADYRNGNRDGKKDIYTFENYNAYNDIHSQVNAYVEDKKYEVDKNIGSSDAKFRIRRDYFTKTAQTRTDSIRFYIYVNAEKNYDLYDFTGWTITDKFESQSFDRKDDLKIKPGSVRIYYADSNRPLAQCKELDNTGVSYQDQSFSYQVPEGYGKKYIVISYDVIPNVEMAPGETLSCWNKARISAGDRFFESEKGGSIKVNPAYFKKECTSYNDSELYWKCSFSSNSAFVQKGYHFVDYMWTTGYKRTGDDHYLDTEDMDFKVVADGKVIPEGEDTWTFNLQENYGDFGIYFHNDTPYKSVVITYKTKMKKQPEIYAYNKFYLYARGGNGLVGQAADSVMFNRTHESDVCKQYKGFDASTGTMEWWIGINKCGEMSGQVELREILPEGHTFVDASVVQVGDGYGEDSDKVTVTLLSSEPGQVKLSVDGIKSGKPNQLVNGKQIRQAMMVWIKVTTKLTPEQMTQYVLGKKLVYTNRVILRDDTDNPELEATATGAIQTKTMTKEGIYEDGIASYTVDINPSGADVVPGEDRLTLTDEMDERMVLHPETIKLVDESGTAVNYDLKLISPYQFEITVPDSRHLTLTYDSYVKGKVGEVYAAVSNTISYKGYTTTPGETHTFRDLRIQRCAAYAGGYHIFLKKMSSDGELLSGAQFQIYYFDGEKRIPDKIITTDANGEAVIPVNFAENDTKAKKYAYQEIKAPKGYVLDSEIYEFYVAAPKGTSGTGQQPENIYQIGSELLVLNEKKAPEPTPTLKPTETPTATPTATQEPTETSSATPEPSPTATILPTVAPSTTPSSTATPGQEEVPQTPPGPAQNEQVQEVPEEEISPLGEAQVLGAVRVKENGVVLGARRGVDFAVLGKRRRPSTGDSSALLLWIILLGGAAVTAGTSIVMCKVSSKKK